MGMLTSGEVPCLAPGNTDPTDDALMAAQAEMQHVELIACIPRSFNLSASGNDIDKDELRSGGVLLLHTTVRSRGLTAFELPEYMSLWSLYGPPIVTNPISKNEPGSGQNSTKDGTQLDVTETDAVAPRTLKEKAESEVTKSMNTDKPESVIPEEPPTSVDILTSGKISNSDFSKV